MFIFYEFIFRGHNHQDKHQTTRKGKTGDAKPNPSLTRRTSISCCGAFSHRGGPWLRNGRNVWHFDLLGKKIASDKPDKTSQLRTWRSRRKRKKSATWNVSQWTRFVTRTRSPAQSGGASSLGCLHRQSARCVHDVPVQLALREQRTRQLLLFLFFQLCGVLECVCCAALTQLRCALSPTLMLEHHLGRQRKAGLARNHVEHAMAEMVLEIAQ